MGPSAAAPPLTKQWGFPIVPILLPSSPWLDSSSLPSGADLRFALSSMLSSATLPDSKQNFATYNQRCEYLLSVGPTCLKSKPPPIAWPPAPLVSHTSVLQGQFGYATLYFFFFLFFLYVNPSMDFALFTLLGLDGSLFHSLFIY